MAETQIEILKDLGGGLVMRRSTRADAERLAAFNSRIHGEDAYDADAVAAWTRDLILNPPSGVAPEDFVIIEDTLTGQIVSSLDLISQTWAYAGIPFGVGRPELVGTDPHYRNRGLVREAFAVIHAWSRQRGELVQVITGIPYFYRQFGYEMGLNLSGGRAGYAPQVPKLKEGQSEPYAFRPAVAEDIPFLLEMDALSQKRSLVSALRDAAYWRNELFEKSKENVNRVDVRVISDSAGQRVGYLAHPGSVWGANMMLTAYQLAQGISYLAVSPSVIRYLWSVGQEYAQARERTLEGFGFWLGSEHPAYTAAAQWLVRTRKPYAFFVRVPDLPAFLMRISPVLEQRLAESLIAGYTGELKVSFYRDGICFNFEQGRLVSVAPWKPQLPKDEGEAAFPDLTFLQMVFGYRTFEELAYAFADCWAKDEAQLLLNVLFPKKPSDVWPVS